MRGEWVQNKYDFGILDKHEGPIFMSRKFVPILSRKVEEKRYAIRRAKNSYVYGLETG